MALLALLITLVSLVAAGLAAPHTLSHQNTEPLQMARTLQDEPVIADAGPDAIVAWNTSRTMDNEVVLDASATTGPTDPKRYQYVWTFYDDGPVELRGRVVSYTWKHVGVFTVTLNATDTVYNISDTDEKTVTVVPKAAAGTNRQIMEGSNQTLITFNGSASGSNNGIDNYTWIFNYSGEQIVNYNVTWTFNFTKPGTYVVLLKITDGLGYIGYGNVTIQILKKPTFFSEHWLGLISWPVIIAVIAYWAVGKYRRDHAIVTPTDVEKARLQWKNFRKNWKIFKSNRLGLTGLIVLVAFVVMALLAPTISTVRDPSNTDNYEPTLPPDWVNPLPPMLDRSPYTGFVHPFGTDAHGEDVYSLTMYGARASLIVGLVATIISVVLGTLIGLSAGYFGKISDEVLMRLTDFFLVLPWFPLMIVMMAILGQKFFWVVVVIGITSWPSTARVVRSQVLTVKERQFIVRAKAIAAGDGHILKTHIMPNVLPLIFANTVLLIAQAIFSEAFLDFFGLGDPSVISWGSMLEGAYNADAFLTGAWWWIAAPGAAIVLMVLAFSLVGYAIDDVLNPKLRRR